MSTTEQKLQKIEELILKKANAKADDLIFNAMTQKNEMLEEKEIEVLQKKYKEINTETLNIRKKAVQHIAEYELKNKRKLLLAKDDFTNRIFENVFVKLCKFTKKDEYRELFKKKLKKMENKNILEIDFYIKSDDGVLDSLIKDIFGDEVNIKEDSDIKIGGFKMINNKTGLCLDETLDSKLSEQKSWFYCNSELLSY